MFDGLVCRWVLCMLKWFWFKDFIFKGVIEEFELSLLVVKLWGEVKLEVVVIVEEFWL